MMKSKFFVLCCITIITTVLMLSGCVTSLNSGAGSSKNVTVPLYTAVRTNNTTVTVILADLKGANSSKGLHIESPSISSPDVISPGTDVPIGKVIKITDANLAGKVNLVITSSVNGNSMIVLNGTI